MVCHNDVIQGESEGQKTFKVENFWYSKIKHDKSSVSPSWG